jgi:hypothetical protein
MRQTLLAVIATFVICFAGSSSFTHAEDTVHPRGQTGFTDGTNAESGTQVITGQEAPQSGATSGVAAVIKNKKQARHQKGHRSDAQSDMKTETKTESKTVTK